MSYLRYEPQPVLLPENSKITREFYDQRTHLPGKPPVSEDDYQGFETHTIFNDVFLDIDGKHLRAIGPPMVNLRKHLLPLTLTVICNDQPLTLTHRQADHDRVTFHTFKLPQALWYANELVTTVQFANGQSQTLYAKRQRLPEVQLQFATLQKNNPVEWILDWLRYCQSIGVQRVLLYDNNSDNFSQLETALSQTNSLPDIVLIHWPFPYGPVKSFYNKFCQASQNNHAYQCFGQSQWTGHFDVDEYLVIASGSSLPPILDAAPRNWALLRFDSYWVPDVDNVLSRNSEAEQPTVRDFNYRNRQSRGKAHKYIVRNRRVRMANTHNAKVTLGFRRKIIPADEMVFLHYKSLTNDWRGYNKRATPETLCDELHVKDDSVQNRMKIIDQSIDEADDSVIKHDSDVES